MIVWTHQPRVKVSERSEAYDTPEGSFDSARHGGARVGGLAGRQTDQLSASCPKKRYQRGGTDFPDLFLQNANAADWY